MNVLSVDLGTSNTVAVLSAHGRPPRVVDVDGASMMPSAVYAADDGSLVVGRDAERRARLDPSRFEPNPKRRIDEGTLLLGDAVVPVTDALAGVLRRVAEETSRQLGGQKPDEVRLTHPAQWGPVRRNVLLSAARQAGMGSNLVLLPEPVAAAAHFASFPGQSLAPGQALAVYDLGAGTFDVAIVAATQNGFAVLAEAGLPDLGGLDVDQALLEHVGRQVSHRDPVSWQRLLRPESTGDRRAQRALREDVRAAKESLSRHPQTEVALPEPFDDVLVSRSELEALIRPSMLRSTELLAATIRSTGLSADRLVGIYLVGGSSRIPLVGTLIAEQLRVVPTSLDQPETAVALGAHHVPREGVTMRTGDMSNTLDAVARTRTMQAPSTGGIPRQSAPPPQQVQPQPPKQPQPQPPPQAYPPSGPQRVQQPMAPQPMRTAPQPNFPMPVPASRPPQPNRKPLIIGGAVAAVLLVVIIVVVAVSGGGGGGGGTAADCSDTSTDSHGMTACMRKLAGSVENESDCQSGVSINGNSESMPASSGATFATCKLSDSYSVIYAQLPAMSAVSQYVDGFFSSLSKSTSDADSGSWSGGGLSGTTYATSVASGVNTVVFTEKSTPVVGTLLQVNLGSSDDPSGAKDYFEANVKPGHSG